MPKQDAFKKPTPESIARYAKEGAKHIKKLIQHPRTHKTTESIRELDYAGHHIVIRTTYDIRVDGIRVNGHLNLGNDGTIHYHAIPNLQFASAIDLVKCLIEADPDAFSKGRSKPRGAVHHHQSRPMKRRPPAKKGRR